MLKAKVTTVGSSVGIVLPKEVLELLNVAKGDTVYFTRTPNGLELTPYDPGVAEEMEAAREGMRAYRHALRELAK
jgi:putative addiction module antidote